MGTTLPFNGKDISAKFDLAEIDDEELVSSGEHIVVFTQFRAVNSAYADRMRAKDIPTFTMTGDNKPMDRPEIVKKWAAAQPGVLICMFQVGGVGLNMTAARHVSFLDKLFVPGLNSQAIDRLHRIGADKTQAIQLRDYQIKNSVDTRINEILKLKTQTIDKTVDSDKESNHAWMKRLVAAALSGD
jgi:SNF2 family DNA or RNA helicase